MAGIVPRRRFATQWVLATLGGWILGIPVFIALSAAVGSLGIRGDMPIGIAFGWGVGFAQWRVARRWFGATSRWMWASTLGLGAPFALTELLPRSLLADWMIVPAAALGGLLASMGQLRILPSRSSRAVSWVVAGTCGWTLAAAIQAAFMRVGPHFTNILLILAGGVALGAVTGGALLRAGVVEAVPSQPVGAGV